jgi:WD40 repeat protein
VPTIEPLQHDSAVVLARLSPDGVRALTVTEGTLAWVWVLRTGPPYSQQVALDGVVNMARFSSDGRYIVSAQGSDMAAQVWDSFTGQPQTPKLRDNVNFPLLWAEFSPDGETFVAGGWVHALNVWRVQDAKLLHKLKHSNSVRSGQFAPDGKRIVTACDDGTGQVWDAATGASLSILKHLAAVNSVHVSPDSRLVVTASKDKTAQVWTIPDGRAVGEALRHQDEVYCAQFSSDGRRILTASKDKTAQVWHTLTGQPSGEAIRHDDAVAFAGRRFNASGVSAPVPVEELFRLRQAQTLASPRDPLTRWAKWLFNSETNRAMSAGSNPTHAPGSPR